jgi:hypothetical protein
MNTTTTDTFRDVLALLRRLDDAKIGYRLTRVRDEALMVEVAVPGERWEIEFVDYENEVHVEIERFRSNGRIEDESYLDVLFSRFSAESPEMTPEEVRDYNDDFFRQ